MLDDGDGLGVGIFHFPDGDALDALFGVGHGVFKGGRAQVETLHAGSQTGFIHHLEHNLDAFALIAQQFADAFPVFTEIQRRGGRSLDAHFVLDAAGLHVIEFAERAVVVDPVLGDDENRNALGPGGIAFDPGQDGVNDVRGQVMIAGGNEALGSGDQEFSVGKSLGRCSQGAHIRARARLRQAHGAGPFAGEKFNHILLLLLLGAIGVDEARRAVGEAGIHRECVAGGAEKLHVGKADRSGNALAADVRRIHGVDPAAFAKLFVGFPVALGHRHFPVFEVTAFFVAFFERRGNHVDGQLFGLVHDHQQILFGKILERFRFEQLLDAELFKKHKMLITCVH